MGYTFNSIIKKKNFPDLLSEGLHSAVFQNGPRNIVENYRGITLLPILQKVLESAIYESISFVTTDFNEIDPLSCVF